jgi:CelD/BcsL family acetyltransferase involved in cellulose biosynthesis
VSAPAVVTGGDRREDIDLATVASSPPLQREWNALAAATAAPYFRSADWVCSWWETVAHRPPTRVAWWRDGAGALRAVAGTSAVRVRLHRRFPMTVPAAVVAGDGAGDADHCGPVLAAGDTRRRALVAAWLREASGPHSLLAPRWLLPDATVTDRVVCPFLALTGDAEAGPSASFRAQLRKFERRLARRGVTFEWQPAGSLDAATIDALLALHGARRAELGRPTSIGEQHRALLHHCAARAGADRGPAAAVARDGARVVGVVLGFRLGGWFGAYQSGWDPAYASASIGSVLIARAVREVGAAGGHTFDFLRGAEPYKYRFGAVDRVDERVLVPRGRAGFGLRVAGAARRSRSTAPRRD